MFYAPVRTARYAPRGFDRSLERFFNQAFSSVDHSVNVQEDEKTWTLSLDVPGVARENLKIEIEGAVVRLSSTPEAKRPLKASYELPQTIDAATSEATLENGVLTLRLAKLVPTKSVVELAIK